MTDITLTVLPYLQAKNQIHAIRQQVFQQEQGVAPEIDFDGEDSTATHVLAYCQGNPVGTARIRYLSETLAKVERVAVLLEHRGRGMGKALMWEAIAHLRQHEIPVVKIHAQLQAKSFYEKLGFQQKGEVFLEADLPHVEMQMQLS